MDGGTIALTVCLVLFLIGLVGVIGNSKSIDPEELAKTKRDLRAKEAAIKRIYWHISEIERLSAAKTIAIQNGDMQQYKMLCDEKRRLDELYELEHRKL